jgi:hypothetical protein
MEGRKSPSPAPLQLEALAARVAALLPCRRDPERFHMDRHEIAADLLRLARRLGRAA